MITLKPIVKLDAPDFIFKNDLIEGEGWAIFCLIVFKGNIELLAYQKPGCVYQLSANGFEMDSIVIPDNWRTVLTSGIPGVQLVCAPDEIICDIAMLPEFVDMEPAAIAHLRSIIAL